MRECQSRIFFLSVRNGQNYRLSPMNDKLSPYLIQHCSSIQVGVGSYVPNQSKFQSSTLCCRFCQPKPGGIIPQLECRPTGREGNTTFLSAVSSPLSASHQDHVACLIILAFFYAYTLILLYPQIRIAASAIS